MTAPLRLADRVPVVGTPISVVSSAATPAAPRKPTNRPGDRRCLLQCALGDDGPPRPGSGQGTRPSRRGRSGRHAGRVGTQGGWIPESAAGGRTHLHANRPSAMGSKLGGNTSSTGALRTLLPDSSKPLEELAPGIQIAGRFSPPFRPPTDDDIQADADMIIGSGADLVWVGLGMPKQELWMARVPSTCPESPSSALEPRSISWREPQPAHRCGCRRSGWNGSTGSVSNPGRLWRRYLINNPALPVAAWRADPRDRRSED